MRIWNLADVAQLERPSGAGHRGATTALAWVQREDEPDDGLVYGTANGFLVCWKEFRRGEEFVRNSPMFLVRAHISFGREVLRKHIVYRLLYPEK